MQLIEKENSSWQSLVVSGYKGINLSCPFNTVKLLHQIDLKYKKGKGLYLDLVFTANVT
jgi:hypothetical protein